MTPVIVRRSEQRLSPWVRLIEKDVRFAADQAVQTYHALAQADYVSMLAVTPDGLIPLVKQFRPAVEAETWELPAGLVDSGETAETACRREIREELGLEVGEVRSLGTFYADTGRLENMLHAFFVRTGGPIAGFVPEPGLAVQLVTTAELRGLIRDGMFRHQLHMGLLAGAALAGLWDLT